MLLVKKSDAKAVGQDSAAGYPMTGWRFRKGPRQRAGVHQESTKYIGQYNLVQFSHEDLITLLYTGHFGVVFLMSALL